MQVFEVKLIENEINLKKTFRTKKAAQAALISVQYFNHFTAYMTSLMILTVRGTSGKAAFTRLGA